MKKLSITAVLIVLFIIMDWLFSTCPADNTPIYNIAYYSLSQQRLETLKKSSNSVKDQLQAGFSKVSITPLLLSTSIKPLQELILIKILFHYL